jgi:hypothetical protein
MDHHQVARLLAAQRFLIGTVLLVVPGLVLRRWLGPGAGRAEVKVLARAAGAREVGIALGTLRALERGEPARPWVLAGAAADAADALALVAASGRIGRLRALPVALAASAGAAAGASAAGHLGDGLQ